MLRVTPVALLAFLLSVVASARARSQSIPAACPAPPAALTSTRPNIFSEQQEQWLGDAMADQLERDYRPVKDASANEYLNRITARLLAVLPPTKIQFRVLLVESSEINGFSLAGGRVYLTRKLVANARNEDEIAGVIAHEIGHILSHQFAQEMTADMKRLIGVTSVGDRADIYTKFQRLVDARNKQQSSSTSDSDEKQDQADTVSVYATAAAGYHPQSYSDFWDRSFYVNGKVGGRLSDFFGTTKPESKRLRGILKLVNAIPPGCGSVTVSASPAFLSWQQQVIANQAVTVSADSIKTLSQVQLTPPLRMSLQHLRYSRDGKSILAQDESSVYVLSRDPYKLLFRFDAEDSLPAKFSPDSQSIVFHTPRLHTEQWSVPEQKLIAAHEPVARHDCLQSELSPDGRTLVCVSWDDTSNNLNLTLLEAATGQVLFEKKSFFVPTFLFALTLEANRSLGLAQDLLYLSFSADGNTLVIGPSDSKLAFDLRTRTPIKLGGDFKNNVSGAYTFLGNDKLAGINLANNANSGIFSFPDGRQLQKLKMPFNTLSSVSKGGKVLTSLHGDYALGLVDLQTQMVVARLKLSAFDLWDDEAIAEDIDGALVRGALNGKDAAGLSLPLSPLGHLEAVSLSPSGKYLAFSTRTRGGIWDTTNGKRISLLLPFQHAAFTSGDNFYAEFPKRGDKERGIVRIAPAAHVEEPAAYKENDQTRMMNGNLLELKTKDKGHSELIAHDLATGNVLWNRVFDHEGPSYTINFGGPELLFSWLLKSAAGKAELKSQPDVAAEASAIKDKDSARLIEVVDNLTGKLLGVVVVEVPEEYIGVGGVNRVANLLYVTNGDNRTMVYSLSTAAQLRQLFGVVAAADPESRRICTANRRGEAVVYDAEGVELAHFNLGSSIRFAQFREKGDRLMIMTADQKVRTLEVVPTPNPATLKSSK